MSDVPNRPSQPSLMFEDKNRSQSVGPGTYTLAYIALASLTKKVKFL